MSEAASSRQPDAQEPSMEDILASIRRILAEDPSAGEEEPVRAPATPAPAARAAADDAAKAAPPPLRAIPPVGMEDAAPPAEASADSLWDEPDVFAGETPPPVPPSPGAAFADYADRTFDAAPAGRGDDVFVLQPSMRARSHTLVSDEPAAGSTDVLSQLARAILDRRDIAVGARSVTLEGMVREMLRPLLHEWLDRNLPYLIERLVKKEIDLMINRAERLED